MLQFSQTRKTNARGVANALRGANASAQEQRDNTWEAPLEPEQKYSDLAEEQSKIKRPSDIIRERLKMREEVIGYDQLVAAQEYEQLRIALAREKKEDEQERLEVNREALEYAKLASYAYEYYIPKPGGTQLPAGWEVMTKEELDDFGVTAAMLCDQTDEASFAAVVLKSTSQKKIVISYRGTVGTHNWMTNVTEGPGFVSSTTEHTMAMALAQQMKNFIGGEGEWKEYSLSFTGHSLGGGLASAASIVTGLEAFTMDSAPVQIKTIATYLKCSEEEVERRIQAVTQALKLRTVHTTTDPVTNMCPQAYGKAYFVQPDKDNRHNTTVFLGPSTFDISSTGVTLAMSPFFAIAAVVKVTTGIGQRLHPPLIGALLEAKNRALAGHDIRLLIKALEEDIARMERDMESTLI